MRVSRSPVACVAALLVAAGAPAGADDGAPDAPPQRLPLYVDARWAALPQDGTWVAGIAAETRGSRFTLAASGDAMRLRDPEPDGDEIGMFLATGSLRRRLAGNASAWIDGEAVGSAAVAIIGDVGVAAPGIGPGVRGAWRLSRRFVLSARSWLTAPILLADSSAELRVSAGKAGIAAGWRDVRFLPVFGIPARYASGPQLSVSIAF